MLVPEIVCGTYNGFFVICQHKKMDTKSNTESIKISIKNPVEKKSLNLLHALINHTLGSRCLANLFEMEITEYTTMKTIERLGEKRRECWWLIISNSLHENPMCTNTYAQSAFESNLKTQYGKHPHYWISHSHRINFIRSSFSLSIVSLNATVPHHHSSSLTLSHSVSSLYSPISIQIYWIRYDAMTAKIMLTVDCRVKTKWKYFVGWKMQNKRTLYPLMDHECGVWVCVCVEFRVSATVSLNAIHNSYNKKQCQVAATNR